MNCLSEVALVIEDYVTIKGEYVITNTFINAIIDKHINTRYRRLTIICNDSQYNDINISKGLIERIISIAENNSKTQFEYRFEKFIKFREFYFYYDKPVYNNQIYKESLFKYKIPQNLTIILSFYQHLYDNN